MSRSDVKRSMQTISFHCSKQKLAEFAAHRLNFSHEEAGLLVSAQGEMLHQDTALLQNVADRNAICNVTIVKDGETVIDQLFRVTFYTLEAQEIVAVLE